MYHGDSGSTWCCLIVEFCLPKVSVVCFSCLIRLGRLIGGGVGCSETGICGFWLRSRICLKKRQAMIRGVWRGVFVVIVEESGVSCGGWFAN